MADFKVNVTADTQDAERKLRSVDKSANEATKARSIKIDASGFENISKRFKDINADIKAAGNNIQTFYRFSKNVPGIGERVREFEGLAKSAANLARTAPESAAALRENAKAGSILANSFETAGGAAGRLINSLAKAGFALFAVKEAVGVLRGAFNGFFNETIGREVKLRETILKTQTTLASTNKVFRGSTEITDPYEKIISLTGEVGKRIDSIRERSIALAGVTSNEVIEVFGIVATQIGQIGGGLKEAEDLAINFAAALGTFGIPLYQARQEVGSILRGDITMDSYLAKALGITNQDIARAKSEAGGVVKFLEERLAAAVAGQRIAAQGFSGVVSNILDLWELVSQRFGAGLLDPLLGGLSSTFEFLFRIREQIFAIAEAAGRGLGSALGTNLTIIGGGSDLFKQVGAGAEDFAAKLAEGVKKAFASLQADASTFVAPLRNLLEELSKSIAVLSQGLARLAQGFVSIQVENFKALVQIFSNLSEAVTAFSAGLSQVLRVYGQLLQVPFVQYLSQISTQFQLLEKLGVMSAVKLGFAAVGLISAWTPIVTFFQGLVARVAALIGGLVIAVGAAFTRIGAIVAAFAGTLTATYPAVEVLKQQLMGLSASLTTAGVAADKAGVSVSRFGGATTAAARVVGSAILSFIKFNLILLGVQLAVTGLIDIFGRWQRVKDKQVSDKRAEESLKLLATKYKDIGDNADAATRAAKDFNEAVVNARYQAAISEVETLSKKLAELQDDMAKPPKWALDGFFQNWALNRIPEVQRELEKAIKERDRWARSTGKSNNPQDNIRLEAQNRTNLEKEIGELRRQQDSQLFQLRQQQAQKEVDIFRLAGELRILQMERANKKLIEGEEGASAAALDALNTYLSTRERGELDIEASKKQLVIEVTNLEKQISDYRLENEKKIAEIRKRAGDYEKNVADYRRDLAKATGAAPGVSDGFRVGSTGRSSGPHLDIRSPTNDRKAVVDEAVRIIRAWQQQNLPYIQLSNAKIDVKNMTDEGQLRAALLKEQEVHGRRSGGGAIDIAVPAGTLVPVPAGTPNWGGAGGWQATSLQTGNLLLHGLDSSTATPSAQAAAAAAPTPPQSPTFADVAAPAVEKYAAAVRGLSGAMERLRTLQAALTEAKTAAAFEEIAKAAFPRVNLEQYDDQLKEAQITLDAIAASSAEAYDPELLKLAVDEKTKIAIQEREIKEIYAKAVEQRRSGNLTEAELQKLKEELLKKQDAYLKKLAAERKLREQVLDITKQQSALEDLRAARAAIPFDLQRAGLQATNTMAGAFNGEDPARQRQLEAEVRITERRIQLEQDRTKSSEQVQAELAQFALETRAAATVLGQLDIAVRDFQQDMALIRESARTFTEGYKGFLKSVLSGGDISGALTSMLESITDRFLTMALDMAFKPMEELMVQNFKDFFGIEDPTATLQQENTLALTGNTTAITALTAAITSSTTASAAGSVIPVIPFAGDNEATTAATEAASQAAVAVNEQAEATTKAAEAAKTGTASLGQFQSAMGAVVGMAAGVASIAGGIGMVGKGGTYNTLMGLAGIFGGISSVAGAFVPGAGLFGKRAAGGPVSAKRPYLVGEKGPELFVPQASGTVLPNNYLRSNGAGDAAQLPAPSYIRQVPEGGTAVAPMEAAVAAASAANSRLEFSYESTVINNVEYVTSEQFQRGMSDAAERGRALTLKSLQNSVRTRKRVGI